MPRIATSSGESIARSSHRDWRNLRLLSPGNADDRPTLLWIDDFRPGLEIYKVILEMYGFRVLTASSGAEGIRIALYNRFDVVVTDYEMPGIDGEGVVACIKTLYPGTPVLLFSGSALVPTRCRQMVDAVCDKGESRDKLLASIHLLLHKKRPGVLQPPVAVRASENGHRTVA